jgi:spore coat protein CotH
VFDFVHITERSAGYKVHFQKDRPLHGMTTANVIFEYNDRFVMAEPLAFELYRRLGNAACQTDFVRLTLNGHPLGYHLLFEQVNGSFLDRNQIKSGGELYKMLWYGLGIEGQHEKQDHPDRNHRDLVKLLDALNATSGAEQWDVIEKNFNVDQVVTYFAVNMVLSHWDGFFNNYFTYHDRKGSGKWEMYPWDQDKTWGFHDQSGDEVFFDMPVTFGMAGDRPPGGGPALMKRGHWWRPGGFFSAPLLANPEFRKRFLARTRQILEETYTEQVFFPVIDAMAAQLRPEIPARAQALGEDPAVALARLDKNVASLKEHLVKRRQFLLEQDEIAKLSK